MHPCYQEVFNHLLNWWDEKWSVEKCSLCFTSLGAEKDASHQTYCFIVKSLNNIIDAHKLLLLSEVKNQQAISTNSFL